ncbi:MAG: N-acetylmuramoyl-L-alanine amidase, partial [Deltaproteobacteria bacterium]|nr:N-acetylmuramoyl-L-alanine amidase [Deltaproteobacteria bacterium]
AKILKRVLEEKTGCEVSLTRTRDTFLSLEERTAIANARKADLFISIHTNAHEDKTLRGIETYFLNLAKDKESARVAAFENATSAKKISDLEKILHDLMLNTKVNESRQLAKEVHKSIVKGLKADYSDIKDLGTKQAPFYVLLGAEMPSILIESSFITNELEAGRLKDRAYQESIAKAICGGVESYIQQMRTFAQVGDLR